VLASRVLPYGNRKDVGRYTISGLAFSIPPKFRLGCGFGSLAPTGHCERPPVAAQEMRAIPGLMMVEVLRWVGERSFYSVFDVISPPGCQ
jgi:hypothetical protein